MAQPMLKKENSIGITYEIGAIEEWHYEYIIENILGVPESEIEGVDDRGDTRFLFKVTSKKRYESICEKFMGREIALGNGHIIQVDDISSYGTMVEISRVPFEVNNGMLKGMLGKFGKSL